MASKDRLDIRGLKSKASILKVVEHYLGTPVRVTGHGSWWNCPFHVEGTPSFLVGGRTDHDQQWHCFGCGKHGDVLDFISAQEHLSSSPADFMRAVEILAGLSGAILDTSAPAAAPPPPAPSGPPPTDWQTAAARLVEESRAALWTPFGAPALRYLREQRGLADETIREWRLGWNRFTRKDAPASWGIERDRPVWIPQGLVIPGQVGETLWYVKIRPSAEVRRFFAAKYYQIPAPDSERGCLWGVDHWAEHLPVILCEGEMDMLTVWQEARARVNPATLGGASKGRRGGALSFGRWLLRLAAAPRILLAYDTDAAGDTATAIFQQASARFEPVRVPFGGDINGYHVAGGDVLTWVRAALGDDLTPAAAPVAPHPAQRYPVTLVFPPSDYLPTISGQWRRLADGRIEATFTTREELALVLDVAQAIRTGAQS